MHLAALEAIDAMADLSRRGASPLAAVLATRTGTRERGPTEWDHFPAHDLFDPASGSLAYYHAHSAEERVAGEHGHFHLFASPHRRPVRTRRSFVHLLGVSVDAHGRPIRLFTTNRWVTGERWQGASATLRLASGFVFDLARPSRPLVRWLSALPRLFRPQLAALLVARDRTIESCIARRRGADARERVLEDRRLHVVSECPVTLEDQVRLLEVALTSPRMAASALTLPAVASPAVRLPLERRTPC